MYFQGTLTFKNLEGTTYESDQKPIKKSLPKVYLEKRRFLHVGICCMGSTVLVTWDKDIPGITSKRTKFSGVPVMTCPITIC